MVACADAQLQLLDQRPVLRRVVCSLGLPCVTVVSAAKECSRVSTWSKTGRKQAALLVMHEQRQMATSMTRGNERQIRNGRHLADKENNKRGIARERAVDKYEGQGVGGHSDTATTRHEGTSGILGGKDNERRGHGKSRGRRGDAKEEINNQQTCGQGVLKGEYLVKDGTETGRKSKNEVGGQMQRSWLPTPVL
ncbi:hypothetical protein BCR44DRAFT_1204157 [Catenaria anguillulae PL171]|uniref:Uncharacterized protein n=1 Tax=Catenaria anguillulae PL171 TaxID=765915 RepID=A0A1Y2H0M0_9FUNG|nr:hypothetical protein BCR44DRAFT_1204157 [Catenaria anguillulae PL171]